MDSDSRTGAVTLLFTDIEGSTRLWEQQPEQMRRALACHDALIRQIIEDNGGTVVKMVGDGVHAVFAEPLSALVATVQFQQALPHAIKDLALRVRCGVHTGSAEQRDNDFFGSAVNRAARIMSVAHGGQILLSRAVAASVQGRLPADVSLRDLGSVRLRDLGSPERVYQIVHPGLRQHFPTLRSLEATPNNLPQQVTSFIGRDRELAAVKELLAKRRLVTLLGAGGLGKTRLSLQMAAEVLDDYPDGVWFVELAAVADARLVPQAVASVLGVKEEAGHPVLEALVTCVNDRRLLLILDNCEHLVQACAELAECVLRAGSDVKVLASSREALRASGETTYSVPSLAQPDAREEVSVEMLRQYEAVRLFVDRAQAAQGTFVVTRGNAPALAEICQRLDGIPLAIELAAARVRALSVEQIAARLNDRFRLLTGGSRTAMPRQQTLRALIDWSYDLLNPEEQKLFMRLSVFAGSFTLEAAEAVGGGGEIDVPEVLDLLAALVEKSLVELDAAGERYRMLETVCAYAQLRLDETDDANTTRARHLSFFLALADRAASELWGTRQSAWVEKLGRERENLLSALARCGDSDERAIQGLRLIAKLQLYWLPSGMLELGYRLTTEALRRPAAQVPTVERCGALYAASQLAYFLGQFRENAMHAEQSLAIAREIGDDRRAVDALLMWGYGADELDERGDALMHFEAAIALARRIGDRARLSYALNALAGHHVPGNEAAALPLYEESAALAREVGDIDAAAVTLQNIGRALIGMDRSDSARRYLLESLEAAAEIGATRSLLYVLDACVALADRRLEREQSARFLAAANAQLERLGVRRTPGDDRLIDPPAAHARAAMGEAAFAETAVRARALTLEEVVAEAKAWLADQL